MRFIPFSPSTQCISFNGIELCSLEWEHLYSVRYELSCLSDFESLLLSCLMPASCIEEYIFLVVIYVVKMDRLILSVCY